MMNDPVILTAFSVYFAAFTVTVVTLFVIYRLVRTQKPKTPTPEEMGNGRQSLLAIAIGIVVPTSLLVYALFFSPLARLSPDEMHQRELEAQKASSDAELLQMGKGLFGVHCAVCHGKDGNAPDGKGANLTHRVSFESALLNIQRGANNFKRTFPGGMPPMIADTRRAAQVAHYVSSGFSENEEGEMLYQMLKCERCHGPEGRGLEFLGPNIREFDLKTVALVLKNGKNGVIGKMPRFEHFSEEQIKALGLYVIQLQHASR